MRWGVYRCACGRFVGNLEATMQSSIAGYGIASVHGTCARHGRQDVTATSDVWAEDFGDAEERR